MGRRIRTQTFGLPAIGKFGGGEKTIGCEVCSGETDAVG